VTKALNERRARLLYLFFSKYEAPMRLNDLLGDAKRLQLFLSEGPRSIRHRRSITLESLQSPAEIYYDDAGIPYLYANSERDLVTLQGYVHAHDRLFQMEMMRRLALGRIAEMVGRHPIPVREWSVHYTGLSTVEFDALLASFRLEQAAQTSREQADPAYVDLAGAFSEGVNEYLRRHRRPLELSLLGIRPQPWTSLEPFLIYKAFAFTLALIWQAKLTLFALLERYPEHASELRALMALPATVGRPQAPWVAQQATRMADFARAGLELAGLNVGGTGSNAWVLSGEHTKTGKPMLALDPHLPLMAPCIAYFQHLEAPGIRLTGYSGAGVPGIVMGHNQQLAWGLTHAWLDDCDLFLERIEEGRCVTPSGAVELEQDAIEIPVRGQKVAQSFDVRRGPHGPLVSDLLGRGVAGNGPSHDDLALSVRWTGQDGGRDLEAYWALGKASGWAEFRKGCGLFAAPAWNMLYADRDGHIGYQLAGWVPIRRWEGGLDVVDGAKQSDWSEYVSAEDLPSLFDPKEGVIVSANQRIADDDYPHYLSDLFEPPFRAERAETLLAGKQHDLASLRRIQLDIRSEWAAAINANRLQPLARELRDPRARLALILLSDWDGEMDKDLPQPSVFYCFIMAFVRRTLVTRFGEALASGILERFTMPALAVEKMLARAEQAWFATELLVGSQEADVSLIEQSLADAVVDLTGRFGPKAADWSWGKLHRRKQKHLLDAPVLGKLLNIGPVPASGDGSTVNTGILRFSDPFDQFGGTDSRMLIDLEDFDRSRWVNATGESGNPFSPHYRDHFKAMVAGKDFPWPFSREAVEARARHRVEIKNA
jgi:penicillin amidase